MNSVVNAIGVRLCRLVIQAAQLPFNDADRPGQQFIVSARHIVSEWDDVKAALQDAQSDPRGLLTITAPSFYGRRYVLPAVMSFMQLYPQIEIELHLNDHMVDLVEQRVDVAIRIGLLSDSNLVATPLVRIRRIACASPAYLDQFGLPVKGNFRSKDTEALLTCALDGVGIVHLANWLVSDKIASGELVPLLAEFELNSPSAIHAVHLPGRSHNVRANLFIAHLKQELGRE